MKTNAIFLSLLTTLLFLASCFNQGENEQDLTGTLIFKTLNPMAVSGQRMETVWNENPDLTGDTTVTYNTSMKVCIGDIWVSQGEVKAGNPDELTWVRLTQTTNQDLLLVEDYYFAPITLDAGEYKSIKMSLKNIFYRHVIHADNSSIKYELLETMGSTFDPCDENDDSWAHTNYFSTDGNHILNSETNQFQLVSVGEKISGFEVKPSKQVNLIMRWGAGVTTPCTNYLIDNNGNRKWDCGVDEIYIECPPEMTAMTDFLVEYD